MTEIIDARCGHLRCRVEGAYIMAASCSNCGWEGEARYTRGHGTRDASPKCPRCGCRRPFGVIMPGEFRRTEP